MAETTKYKTFPFVQGPSLCLGLSRFFVCYLLSRSFRHGGPSPTHAQLGSLSCLPQLDPHPMRLGWGCGGQSPLPTGLCLSPLAGNTLEIPRPRPSPTRFSDIMIVVVHLSKKEGVKKGFQLLILQLKFLPQGGV